MKNVIAIDLGGTKISTAVVTISGKILKQVTEPSHLTEGWAGLKRQIVRICSEYNKSYKIQAIGIGSAGPLNAKEGTLLDPTNYGWSEKKVFIKRDLEKALKIPVVFDNDAVAAALGEAWKGKVSPNSISVTLGTGLGVGVLVDGNILRGRNGLHPELGHLVLKTADSETLCECGVPGCAEGYLSGNNFAKWISAKSGKNLTAKEVAELAKSGDTKILVFFGHYAELLAQFICSLIVISYPKQIVFSGSFSEASPLFLEKTISLVSEAMKRRQESEKILPEIRISKLNHQSGLFGAAYMALNHKTYLKD